MDASQSFLLQAKIKHYIAKIVSLVLLVNGLRKLGISFYEVFHYSQAVQSSTAIAYSQFQEILKVFLVETIESVVETIYGFILFFLGSHKLKILHIVVGIAIILLPWIINEKVLKEAESKIPKVQIVSQVLAQTTSSTQALSDYQFQLQAYRTAHSQYERKKNLYNSFQTLTAKTESLIATKDLLIKRDESLRTYLFALRIYVNETPKLSPEITTATTTDLVKYESILRAHEQKVPRITAVNELNQVSKEVETQYPKMQEVAFRSLYATLKGRQTAYASELITANQQLQTLVEKAADGQINKPQINQWIKDSFQVLDQNQISYTQAEELLAKIKAQDSSLSGNQRNFAKIITVLQTTQNNLLKVTAYLKETLELIKYD